MKVVEDGGEKNVGNKKKDGKIMSEKKGRKRRSGRFVGYHFISRPIDQKQETGV